MNCLDHARNGLGHVWTILGNEGFCHWGSLVARARLRKKTPARSEKSAFAPRNQRATRAVLLVFALTVGTCTPNASARR